MQGRLSRALARKELEHCGPRNGNQVGRNGSYVLGENGKPVEAVPANITPEQLPAILAELGHPVQWRIDPDVAQGLVWFVVKLGPLVVPLGLDVAGIRKVIDGLTAAAELLIVQPDAAAEAQPATQTVGEAWQVLADAARPVTDDDYADLLEASINAVAPKPAAELLIVEESSDVPAEVWDAIESLEPSRVIRLPRHDELPELAS